MPRLPAEPSGNAKRTLPNSFRGDGKRLCQPDQKPTGAAQEAKGNAQKAVGDAKTATKHAVDKTAETIKKPL